ncbi:GTP pyrophosphokinase [Pseudomonas protegens]|uniref:GTP pyrophosphokinase n=1 Tax=Pseudomonas protegens TaxID=380021 RepID=UPI00380C0D8C
MTDIIQQYRDVKPKLERLRVNIESVLKQIIDDKKVPLFSIESRLKDESSLASKAVRKHFENELDKVDDLCGIRVICYYQEDIKSICDIVEKEFCVLKKENKKDSLNDNQFGYTSYHYVVSLKEEWLSHPAARGLEGVRAEIQIRTMLMHTWAAISHKLLYKRESDVPAQFKRQLNRLSALIELADEQFDAIKNVKIQLVGEVSEKNSAVQVFSELTSDALVYIYQRYFENRKYDEEDISELLEEVRGAGFDFNNLVDKVELCLPVLDDLEREEAADDGDSLPMWSFTGAIRTILDLTSDSYFAERAEIFPEDYYTLTKKYRDRLR